MERVNIVDLFIAGVDHDIPGNGGLDCVNYSSYRRRVLESAFALTFAFGEIYWSWNRLKFPKCDLASTNPVSGRPHHITYFRRILIAWLCLIFGIEIGFKFSSQTLIYLLNPCHMVTIMQIGLLLCDPRGKLVTFFFRFHVYTLAGAFLALIFPVLNTRLLPVEADLYYVQHYTILLIPFYLMTYGGSFSAEAFYDPAWCLMFCGILFVYHFFFLHILGVLAMVNLNNMVCPAITDPFRGRFYRLCGLIHQSLFIPLFGKVYFVFGQWLLRTLDAYPLDDADCCQYPGNGHIQQNGATPVDHENPHRD